MIANEDRHADVGPGLARRLRSGLAWTVAAGAILAVTGKLCYETSRPFPPPIPGVKATVQAEMPFDMARIRGHVAFLASQGTRLAGTPGNAATAEYIKQTLRQAGITDIRSQPFTTVTPAVGDEPGVTPDVEAASITLPDGRRLPLYPLWPNGARTCQTPPEGLQGHLVDGGSGSLADLSGKDINGAFVLVDWNCDRQWQHVPELGGRAVLFRPSDTTSGYQARSKALTIPADIPRFYVKPDHIGVLERAARARQVDTSTRRHVDMGGSTIRCSMRWGAVETENIIAHLPANSSASGTSISEEDDKPLIFHAYYDSISIVPQLAPGAEQACGVAALLDLGRYLVKRERTRDIVLLFTSAHTQACGGMRAYVAEYLMPPPTGSKFRKFAEPKQPCALLTSLDLTSGTPQLGVFCKGYFCLQPDIFAHQWFALLGRTLAQYVQPVVDAIVADRPAGLEPQDEKDKPDLNLFVDGINASKGANWSTYFPFMVAFETELANLGGISAVTLATPNDSRDRIDSPMDTVDRVRFDRLAIQMRLLAPTVDALLNWRGPYASKKLESLWTTLKGRVVYLHPTQSYVPDFPLPNALVVLKNYSAVWNQVGVRAIPMLLTDQKGAFEIGGLLHQRCGGYWRSEYDVEAFGVDPNTGAITYANNRSAMTLKDYPCTVLLDEEVRSVNVVVFPCMGTTLYGLTEPREYLPLWSVEIFDAATNSPPFRYGYSWPDPGQYGNWETATTLFAPPDTTLRLGLGTSPVGFQMVLTNARPDNALGDGFDIRQLATIRAMALQGAGDMWALTQERFDKLHRYGVRNPRAERLHAEAGEFLDQAREALDRHDYVGYRIAAERAWSSEIKAYPEILSAANDMVQGVIFYLALLLPFAYAMERLLICAPTIRGRIIGMLSIFVVGFLVLAVVHPAFRFTLTPALVLLAFVILALVVTVSMLVWSKFDAMLQEVRTARLGMHEADVNRAGAAVSAFDLGLSNVRRHRRRAILTATTVVVVTFTLLSFTSITPTLAVRGARYFLGEPSYSGLLIRDRNWFPLSRKRYKAFLREMGGHAPVAARAWYESPMVGELTRIEVRRHTSPPRLFVARALVGMTANEPNVTDIANKTIVAGRWFKDDQETGILLPQRMAERLGLRAEGGQIVTVDPEVGLVGSATGPVSSRPSAGPPTVEIYGRKLPVIGIFNERKYDDILDLDGEPLTPVDHVLMAEKRRTEILQDAEQIEEYIHFTCDAVPIVPLRLALDLGGSIRSIATHLPPDQVHPWTQQLSRRTDQTMFANLGGDVRLFSTVSRTQFGGVWSAAVPMAIGCLIVLSTMLGAVYERQREIFICSSVGLAPSHVSSLFLAESCVYAILGAALGYLLGQALTKVLMTLGLLTALSLNYSAMSAVLVTMVTMLVVVATTIYPARVAFRAAMPEEPQARKDGAKTGGDRFVLDLPFLASAEHLDGVQAYLYEFLDAHADVWIGKLSVDRLHACRRQFDGAVIPVLEFRSWLVPFDLGISQHVEIGAVYRPDHHAFQYQLIATRSSGDYQNWRRLNPHFLKIIRKQLLLWRILSPEEKQRYVDRGPRVFGHTLEVGQPVDGPDAEDGTGPVGPPVFGGPTPSPAGGAI